MENKILKISCERCNLDSEIDPDKYAVSRTKEQPKLWAFPIFRCGGCGFLCKVLLVDKKQQQGIGSQSINVQC